MDKYKSKKMLLGTTVASMQRLKDLDGSHGSFFIFYVSLLKVFYRKNNYIYILLLLLLLLIIYYFYNNKYLII